MAAFKTVPHSQLHQRRVRRLGLTETRWMTTASFKTVLHSPRSSPRTCQKAESAWSLPLVLWSLGLLGVWDAVLEVPHRPMQQLTTASRTTSTTSVTDRMLAPRNRPMWPPTLPEIQTSVAWCLSHSLAPKKFVLNSHVAWKTNVSCLIFILSFSVHLRT